MAPYGSLWLPVVYHLDPSGIVQDQGPSLSSAWTKASKASILHIYSQLGQHGHKSYKESGIIWAFLS